MVGVSSFRIDSARKRSVSVIADWFGRIRGIAHAGFLPPASDGRRQPPVVAGFDAIDINVKATLNPACLGSRGPMAFVDLRARQSGFAGTGQDDFIS